MEVPNYLQRSILYRKLLHGPHSDFARVFLNAL